MCSQSPSRSPDVDDAVCAIQRQGDLLPWPEPSVNVYVTVRLAIGRPDCDPVLFGRIGRNSEHNPSGDRLLADNADTDLCARMECFTPVHCRKPVIVHSESICNAPIGLSTLHRPVLCASGGLGGCGTSYREHSNNCRAQGDDKSKERLHISSVPIRRYPIVYHI